MGIFKSKPVFSSLKRRFTKNVFWSFYAITALSVSGLILNLLICQLSDSGERAGGVKFLRIKQGKLW